MNGEVLMACSSIIEIGASAGGVGACVPLLVFRGLLGMAEPILITGGRAVADYREAFVGIDVAKLKNANTAAVWPRRRG